MLTSIAEKLRQGRKLILLHGNADPDALGCGYAIARSFPEADICAPGGMDKIAKVIARKLDLKVLEWADLMQYDQVVVVDTSSPDQLGEFASVPEGTIIIDHHARSDRWGATDVLLRRFPEELRGDHLPDHEDRRTSRLIGMSAWPCWPACSPTAGISDTPTGRCCAPSRT